VFQGLSSVHDIVVTSADLTINDNVNPPYGVRVFVVSAKSVVPLMHNLVRLVGMFEVSLLSPFASAAAWAAFATRWGPSRRNR
jgi:hypothetical protein